MKCFSPKSILAAAAFGALLGVGGCATTIDAGPGYYRYDSRVATTVYREPAVVYREPTVVYREAPILVY